MPTTAKSEKVYSPAELARKLRAGTKPAIVTSVPASIGKRITCGRRRSRPSLVVALRQTVVMASIVVMASSTSKASAMISAPREMRCISILAISIIEKTIASVSGIAVAITRRRPHTETDEADRQNDGDRLPERRHELGYGAFHGVTA